MVPTGGAPGGGSTATGLSGGQRGALAVAMVLAVGALVGGSLVVSGHRAESSDGPTTTEEDPETTDPESTDSSTESSDTTDPTETSILGGPATYDEYEAAADDTGAVAASFPTDWEVHTAGVQYSEDEVLPAIQASEDLDGFRSGLTTSGAELIVTDEATYLDLVSFYQDSCDTVSDPETISGSDYTGTYELYSGCTGGDGEPSDGQAFEAFITFDSGTSVFINVNLQIDADFEATQQILDTISA